MNYDKLEIYFNNLKIIPELREYDIDVIVNNSLLELKDSQLATDLIFTERKIEVTTVVQTEAVKEKWGINDYELTADGISYVGQETETGKWAIVRSYGIQEVVIEFATKKNNPQYESYTEAWQHRYDLTYTNFDDAF